MSDKPAKRGRGAPTKFNAEMAEKICHLVTEGHSLRQIAKQPGMPVPSTITLWLLRHDDFSVQYTRAREIQADRFADEIVGIADDGTNDWIERERKDGSKDIVLDHEHVDRSRLRVDARKWLMARMAPKKYGERVTQELIGKDGGPINISQRLNLGGLGATERAQLRAILERRAGRPGAGAQRA